jgi:hypothetical protein
MTTNPLSRVPRELASNWVYKVHAWRGKSPEFMQAQVSRLEAVIREAMQRAQPQWISVEEKLPEEDASVLAAIPFYGRDKKLVEIEVLHCAYYQGGIGSGQKIFTTCEGEEYEAGDVTHWMPLPEPPNTAAVSLTEQEVKGNVQP